MINSCAFMLKNRKQSRMLYFSRNNVKFRMNEKLCLFPVQGESSRNFLAFLRVRKSQDFLFQFFIFPPLSKFKNHKLEIYKRKTIVVHPRAFSVQFEQMVNNATKKFLALLFPRTAYDKIC